jgi:hypothetical protein
MASSDKQVIHENEFPKESVAYDLDAFENLVQAHGLIFTHYVAMKDPVGLINKTDIRRPNAVQDDHISNGFYYVEGGKIRTLFAGNTKEVRASSGGITDPGIAQITPSLVYLDSGQKTYMSVYDRLYLDESSILTTRTDLVNLNQTGIDRLPFPAVEVLYLVDSDGVRFSGPDFDIVNGAIHWGSKRPSSVYSIKYTYRPFWLISRMVHDLRIVQAVDYMGGRQVKQAHQSSIVQREYLYLNALQNEQGTNPRGVQTPEEAELAT